MVYVMEQKQFLSSLKKKIFILEWKNTLTELRSRSVPARPHLPKAYEFSQSNTVLVDSPVCCKLQPLKDLSIPVNKMDFNRVTVKSFELSTLNC